MLVFAYIKVPENVNELGAQSGDIIGFEQLDYPWSDEEIKRYLPIVFDINIPCGTDFHKNIKCVNCPYNDEELCDNIKYTRGVWGPGDIDNPPQLLLKRKYTLDWESIAPKNLKNVIRKLNKSQYEKEQIINFCLANPVDVIYIIDKTA